MYCFQQTVKAANGTSTYLGQNKSDTFLPFWVLNSFCVIAFLYPPLHLSHLDGMRSGKFSVKPVRNC